METIRGWKEKNVSLLAARRHPYHFLVPMLICRKTVPGGHDIVSLDSLITSIVRKAKKEIILIDGYVDVDTLNILAKKKIGVDVKIFTYASAKLTNTDAANFNAQYPTLTVKKTQVFHDRFIILDGSTAYHIGASIMDAGKKCFGISLMTDSGLVAELLNRLNTV